MNIDPLSQDQNRAGDILQGLLASIEECQVQAIPLVFMRLTSVCHAAGFGESLDTVGDIDAIFQDIIVLDNDVTKIDANTKDDAFVVHHLRFWHIGTFGTREGHSDVVPSGLGEW